MSSWSSNYSRNASRTNLKPASSFDYHHGHSGSNTLEAGKQFRPQGSGKIWTDGGSSLRPDGAINNYSQKQSGESGQTFRNWKSKPDWRSDMGNQEESGSSLLGSENRPGLLQASLDLLPELSRVKKSMDMLLKMPSDLGSMAQSSHSSGIPNKPYPSLMSDTSMGSNARNLSFNNVDGLNQRKKTTKAFEYLKTWRLKMNMPTDSFNVETDVAELMKRQNSESSPLDASFERNYSKAAGDHPSGAQFNPQLFGSPEEQIPNLSPNIKGGGRMASSSLKWNDTVPSTHNTGYKRNYNSITSDKDSLPFSGSLGTKRPRLIDEEDSRLGATQFDGPFQNQPFDSYNNSNLYDSSNWKNPGLDDKRESSDWHSRSGSHSLDQIPDKWTSTHSQSRQQSSRRIMGRRSPQQPNRPSSSGLNQRNHEVPYPRRLSPNCKSPESSWSRLRHESPRGRSPEHMTSKARSPYRGHSPIARQRFSPEPESSSMQSPGSTFRGQVSRFSPKGRSPGLLQREKSPRFPHKHRSPGPSSKGRPFRPSPRRRSPKPFGRRSASPNAGGLSSRFARGRASASGRSPDHGSHSRLSDQPVSNRMRYQHARGRSPGRSSNDKSHRPHGSKSPGPMTREQMQKPHCEKSLDRRSPDRFKRKASPEIGSRGMSPGYIGRDRSSVRHRSHGRENSPRSASIGKSLGYPEKERFLRGRSSENPIDRSTGQSSRGRSTELPDESVDLRESLRPKESWSGTKTNKKTINQRKKSSVRERPHLILITPTDPLDDKPGDSQNRYDSFKRSPMFEELSPSPRSSNFWSPGHASLQGKKPELRNRDSWSPVDLQRGCSPVSPQPAFEGQESRSSHVEGSPLSSLGNRRGDLNRQSSKIQRGCSPVSPEGFSRSWSNNLAKRCDISPSELRELSEYKRKRSPEQYRRKASMDDYAAGFDTLEDDSRRGMQTPLDDEHSEGDKGNEDEDDDEDLRVHLLRLREQKVEMKLKMLEEESIETEYKLRQLQKSKMLEGEEGSSRNRDRRFWSDKESGGRLESRVKNSRSSSPNHSSSRSRDRHEANFGRRHSPYRERGSRNQHSRFSPHLERRHQKTDRY